VVLKRGDRPGALVPVLNAVVVGIGIARVIAGLPLLPVLQAVAVLISLGLVLVERQVVALLPSVRNAVVVSIASRRRAGQGDDQWGTRPGPGESRHLGAAGRSFGADQYGSSA